MHLSIVDNGDYREIRGLWGRQMWGREFRLLSAGITVLLALGCGPGSVAFREGHRAELRKDYDTALVDYQRALQSQPDNSKFLIHEKLARTQASFYHLKQGRTLLVSGRQDDAAGEFQKAVSIDPANEAAAQELSRLVAAQAAAKHAREGAIQQAMHAREEAAEPAGVQLKALPVEPLGHFRISADSRKVFESLAKLADLNVAFTADFQARQISVDLTNVKIEDALRVVNYQTKSFWKPVTPNTILVIPDTPNNRREYEEEVLKTVYLSNPLSPADRTQITTALKQILGLQRIMDNPDSNAIIIRDTPERVAEAEKLIRDLDQGKAEILVEVAVVEADRNRIRDLGLTQVPIPPLPSTGVAGLLYTPSVAATTTSTSGGTTVTTTLPAMPLNRLGRVSTHDFSIIVPGAVANALLNDSRTHILQNPQVRVTDGQTAKLRIGSRIPYAQGSFLPSFGGGIAGGGTGAGSIGLLASTQFQFQDVGVNLDLTPHLMANGEVSLHALIEISSLGPSASFGGGLQEPTFNQRKIEHEIRLKEGEVNLLGGLIESTDTLSVSGLPGLGQVPLLRYLFSSERRERVETEVLVMLTPRVIRLPEYAAATGKGVPVGAALKTSEPGPAPEGPVQPTGPPQ